MTGSEPPTRAPSPGTRWPVLTVGLRPFYLGAAGFAVLALPLWVAQLSGMVGLEGYLQGLSWHRHEMLFGFASAVIAGFLLTAVRHWTELPTPTGGSLGALVLLWGLGRVLVLSGPASLGAVVDALFLPTLAVVVAVPIWRSRKTRSFAVVAMLAVLALANGMFHLSQLGAIPARFGSLATLVGLDVIALLMTVIGGRIIPAFLANALPQAGTRRLAGIERVAVGSMVAILIADVLGAWFAVSPMLVAALLGVGALAQLARLWLWNPLATRGEALLWMLPLSYAWIPVALALRAGGIMGEGVYAAVATHALGVGAMSGLMLAMMTRSALGHTGRALEAGVSEMSIFWLIQAAAAIRVFLPLAWPEGYQFSLYASASCWTAAFVIFLSRYLGILTRPRIDEKPG